MSEDADRYAEQARVVRGLGADADVESVIGLDPGAEGHAGIVAELGAEMPMGVARVLFEDPIWADRFRRDEAQPVAVGRTLATWIDKDIELYLARRRAGEISPAEVQAARLSLHAFRDWLGGSTAIDAIDAAC